MAAGDELRMAESWTANNVLIDTDIGSSGTLCLRAAVVFPFEAQAMVQLLTHPYTADIYRGIERCSLRKCLASDDASSQSCWEVENESSWNVFGLVKGTVRTRLVVLQNLNDGMVQFALAPGAASPLKSLWGRWVVHPLSRDLTSSDLPGCFVTLEQRFQPRNVPRLLFGAFAKLMTKQVLASFEDLYMEIQRTHSGRPILAPYPTCWMNEILPPADKDGAEDQPLSDPRSALDALEAASASSASSEGTRRVAGWQSPAEPPSLDRWLSHVAHRMQRRRSLDSSDATSSRSAGSSHSTVSVASSRSRPLSHPLSSDLDPMSHPAEGQGLKHGADGVGGSLASAAHRVVSGMHQVSALLWELALDLSIAEEQVPEEHSDEDEEISLFI